MRLTAPPAGLLLALGLLAGPFGAAPALAGPEQTGMEFVKSLQAGKVDRAKRLLDDPRYRGRPAGGDDAYFVYESGYEPNLAFLVGRQFDAGAPTVSQQRSDWYLLDGIIYATASFPLRFAPERNQPWVLPAAIALGRRMEFVDFMNFVAAPDRQGDHLTFRLRPSIEPGLIKPPAPPAWRLAPPPPPAAPAGGQPARPAMATGAEPSGLMGMPAPVDPAPVVLPSGEALTPAQLKRFLPRLAVLTLHVHLVRRGRLASWTVSRWSVSDVVLVTEKGEVRMGAGPAGVLRGQ